MGELNCHRQDRITMSKTLDKHKQVKLLPWRDLFEGNRALFATTVLGEEPMDMIPIAIIVTLSRMSMMKVMS